MSEILKSILSMSISGAVMTAAILLLKPLLKNKLSKSWQYYIWLLVLLRLLLPFSAEGSMMNVFFAEPQKSVQQFETVGQVPDLEVVQPTVTAPMVPTEPSVPVEKPTNPNNNTIPLETVPITKPQEVEPHIDWTVWIQKIVSSVWLLWVVIAVSLFVRKVYIYQRFVRHIRKNWKPVEEIELLDHVAVLAERIGVRQAVELCISGSISTPMLIGFWKPCVLLPKASISPSDFDFTVLHELTHYKRRDMLYKWLVQLTLCLHWFNPLVYLMEKEISRCCELSCDEMVIKHLDRSGKQAYGDTLINAAGKKDLGSELASVTLSESGELLKERLLAILNYRKMSKRFIALALALTLLLSACGTVLGAYVKREEVEEEPPTEELPAAPIVQEQPIQEAKPEPSPLLDTHIEEPAYIEYVRSLNYLLNGNSWSDPMKLAPSEYVQWACTHLEGTLGWVYLEETYHVDSLDATVPAELIEEAVWEYFGIPAEYLRSDPSSYCIPQYESETGEYYYEKQYYIDCSFEILSTEEKEDKIILTLAVHRDELDWNGILTLKKNGEKLQYQSYEVLQEEGGVELIYDKIDVSLYQYGQLVQTVSVTEKWQMRRLLENTLYSDGTGELRSESDFEEMHEYVVVNIDGHDPFYFFADKGRELSYGDGTTTLYPYSHPYYRQSGNRCDQIGSGWFLGVYELTNGESNYRMNLESNSNVDLNFHNIDFIPEFSEHNLGSIHYLEAENQLWVSVLRHIGTTTGAPGGPALTYTVDFDDNSIVDREYRPVEAEVKLRVIHPDDGTMETMSDERLVEVAKQLRTLMKSYRLPLITENLRDENSLSKYNITMTAADDRLISHGSYVTTDDITILEICSVAETQEKLLVKPKDLFDVIEQTECALGKWSGQSYHIRWFTEQGGMSGYQHEYHYFLTDGTYWVYAAGYPLYGNGGVDTQVERFEQCLSTLEVTPPQPVLENPIDADRLKELPVVTGPDENGYFPLISEALWNQHVIHSDERAIMPTTAILPFMENEDCRKLLSSIYSGSQLEVLYEHRSYTLVEDMYDPYRYEYRDQYVPTWVVVLKVENCSVFDRVVIAARQEYSAWKFRDSNREILGMKSKQYWDEVHSTGWEADWNLGDCIGLTPAFGVKANWHPSLWFQDEKRGLLLDNDNIQAALPVSDTNAILSSVYSYADLGEYIQPPQGKEQDKLVSTANGIAYYSVKDKRLSAFENSSGKEYFLNNERILSLGYYSAELYDLSAENAPKLLMNSAEWGANLYFADGYGSDWAEEHFALMYYKESEQRWNAVIFDADGKVLHHIPTELSAIMTESMGVPLYNIMDISLSEGRISFNYYPDGQGSGTWEQYAIDTKVSDELLKIR